MPGRMKGNRWHVGRYVTKTDAPTVATVDAYTTTPNDLRLVIGITGHASGGRIDIRVLKGNASLCLKYRRF